MKKIPLLIIVLLLTSCSKQISNLEKALEDAGKNKPELEKVLKYYEREVGDSLKYKAAVFLIENMPYHYYYEGELLDQYSDIYKEMMRLQKPDDVMDSFENKFGAFSVNKLKKCEDIKCIKADFLINNIDFSFKVWKEQPWGKNITFDDFCMYILPYRVNMEQPVEWRQYLYDKYNPLLDSLRKNDDATNSLTAAQIIMNSLCVEEKFFTTTMDHIPLKTPLIIDEYRAASCRNMADLSVYILRALGIPSGVEYLPVHGRVNSSHSWTFILDKDGNTFTSDYFDCKIIPALDNLHFTTKIYRETFNINKNLRSETVKFKNKPAPFLRDPLFLDVTEFYSIENKQYSLCFPDTFSNFNGSDNLMYLCVSKNRNWEPIVHAAFKDKKFIFNNLKWDYYLDRDTLMSSLTKETFDLLPNPAKDYIETVVFRLAYWKSNRLEFLTDPFLVNNNGDIDFLRPNEDEKNKICVFSKYDPITEGFIQHMPNGIFEASNDKDFKNADTLFEIKEIPYRLFHSQTINIDEKYRYVRYKGAFNTYCSISEIQIYGNTDILKGTPYGYINGDEVKGHTFDKAFDGDPYTSFYTPNNSGDWVGIDLGEACHITKIIYTPRNRDNFIRVNDEYELFYQGKNKWVSLGIKTAESDSLIFENVPSNALFYLKNHTRGKDERIFLYKDNVQIYL